MVHANDPLRPCEVLNRHSDVSELPVRERADRVTFDQHVLWSEIAVDDHRSSSHETGHGRGRNLLERDEDRTQLTQDRGCATRVDQFLAGRTGRVANDEQRDFGISFECVGTGSRPARHTRHTSRDRPAEAVQPLVSLLNPPAREPARQVRAPMAKATHAHPSPDVRAGEAPDQLLGIRRLRSHPAASAISALIFCRARAGPAITARAQVSIIATPKASFQQSRTPVRPPPDTPRGGRKRRYALEVDVTSTDRTDHPLTLFQLSASDRKCVAVRTRLSQQGTGLRPFIRDCGAFGIVLVIGGGQLGSVNDGGDDGLKGRNLTGWPFLLGLDDLQNSLDVEHTHPDNLDLPLSAPQPTPRHRHVTATATLALQRPDIVGPGPTRSTAAVR